MFLAVISKSTGLSGSLLLQFIMSSHFELESALISLQSNFLQYSSVPAAMTQSAAAIGLYPALAQQLLANEAKKLGFSDFPSTSKDFSPSPVSPASPATPASLPSSPSVASDASDQEQTESPEKPVRDTRPHACSNCYRARRKCDGKRPCARCIEHNRADRCFNKYVCCDMRVGVFVCVMLRVSG